MFGSKVGRRHFEQGMVLMEAMISLALGGMVIMGLAIAYAYAVGLWGMTEKKLAMHIEGTLAIDEIAKSASEAHSFVISNEKELTLNLPASPLIEDALPVQKTFQLRDEILWVDKTRFIPSEGDSGIGVVDFQVEEKTDPVLGVRVLAFKICLYVQETRLTPSDSLWFSSEVHLRNRDLGKMGDSPRNHLNAWMATNLSLAGSRP